MKKREMRKATASLVVLSCLALFIGGGCSRPERNVLKGEVKHAGAGDRIVLAVAEPGGSRLIARDSASIDTDGRFQIATDVTDEYASLVYLEKGAAFDPVNTQAPSVFLEGYGELTLKGDAENWYYIEYAGGLYDHPDMQTINVITAEGKAMQKEGLALYRKGIEMPDSILEEKGRTLLRESNVLFDRADSLENIFRATHPDMAYSAALLRYNYDLMKNFGEYENAFASLTDRVRHTPAGRVIGDFIRNKKASETGQPAPDFEAVALNGQAVRLSGFKGKYVLLEFWGTWCGPCRTVAPRLVELYRETKDKNLVMIGVACNEINENNLKQVVETEHLDWIQVNDARSETGKSIQKMYAVDGVPTCILVSPEGKIIRRGHPGELIPEIKKMIDKQE